MLPTGESKLAEPVDIGELLTTFLEKNDGASKAQVALEQANLVDHIWRGFMLPSGRSSSAVATSSAATDVSTIC